MRPWLDKLFVKLTKQRRAQITERAQKLGVKVTIKKKKSDGSTTVSFSQNDIEQCSEFDSIFKV